MNDIEKRLEYIIMQNKALIDMLNSLITAYAKQNDLALEDNEEGCEYLNDV